MCRYSGKDINSFASNANVMGHEPLLSERLEWSIFNAVFSPATTWRYCCYLCFLWSKNKFTFANTVGMPGQVGKRETVTRAVSQETTEGLDLKLNWIHACFFNSYYNQNITTLIIFYTLKYVFYRFVLLFLQTFHIFLKYG